VADLTVQSISQTGIAPTFSAATATDYFINPDGRAYLHVKNGSGAAVTVTIDSVEKCNQGFDHDIAVSVPAAGERIIGPFDPQRFVDRATGKIKVTYSATASVTIAVFRI
jgi:hypothetical protein